MLRRLIWIAWGLTCMDCGQVRLAFTAPQKGLLLPSNPSGLLQTDASLWDSCEAFGGPARL